MVGSPSVRGGLPVGAGSPDPVGLVGVKVVGMRLVGRPRCGGCRGGVLSKGWRRARLVDQACFGRAALLEWSKRRWRCPDTGCGVGSFTEQDPRIAPVRARLTSRAGRWATRQVGRGRTVSEVAEELGCPRHTVSKEVNRWGEALLEADRDRVGIVEALGRRRCGLPRRWTSATAG